METITRALEATLRLFYPDSVMRYGSSELTPNATYLVISDRAAFGELWEFRPDFLSWLLTGGRTIVLVGELAGRRALSPIDWAVALALAVAGRVPSLQKCPGWRVIVVDVLDNKRKAVDLRRAAFSL